VTHREKTILLLCLLLLAVTATALVNNGRLRRRQGQLELELARQRLLTAEAAKAAASRPPPAPMPAARSLARTVRSTPAASDNDAELEAYRTENQTLRAQLNEQNAPLATGSQTNLPPGNRMDRGRRGRWQEEEMENLKKTDPKRYQEIETQRTAFRERIKSDTQDKQSFLSSIDVSRWPADMQENHARIVALYDKMAEAIAQSGEGGSVDREAQRQLFTQWRETGELLNSEQDMLLRDTAQQLGFSGGDADQFVDYIKTIHNVTSPRGFFPGRGMGPPGRGGEPGAGPVTPQPETGSQPARQP
jgi:hypothetical protein